MWRSKLSNARRHNHNFTHASPKLDSSFKCFKYKFLKRPRSAMKTNSMTIKCQSLQAPKLGIYFFKKAWLTRACFKNQISICDDKISKAKSTLLSEGHIYFTKTDWAYTSLHHNGHYWDKTHTNIHSLEHSTTWDGLAQINLDLTTLTNRILLDVMLSLLCLHYDLPMYIKCISHLDYIQQ